MIIRAILDKIYLCCITLAVLVSCSADEKYSSISDVAKIIEQKEVKVALNNVLLGEIYIPSVTYMPNQSDVNTSVELILDSNYSYETRLNIVYCLFNSKHRELFCRRYINRLSSETLTALATMEKSSLDTKDGTPVENTKIKFLKGKQFLLTLDKIKFTVDLEIQ